MADVADGDPADGQRLAVEFLVIGVSQPGEVLFLHDRCAEPWFGKDHHPGGRLKEVRAGARADDQEERILDLAVQPDDPGQPAKDLALAALPQNRRILCFATATLGLGGIGSCATRTRCSPAGLRPAIPRR